LQFFIMYTKLLNRKIYKELCKIIRNYVYYMFKCKKENCNNK